MINWNTLVKQSKTEKNLDNQSKSRDVPTKSRPFFESRDSLKPNTDKCLDDKSRPYRPIPTKKEGSRLYDGNNLPGEGVASENDCAMETYPVNPIAMTLLLICCNKAEFTLEEKLEAIINLQTIPQYEQIQSWALLCLDNGIDPYFATSPFTQLHSKGKACQGCKHIEMEKIPDGDRMSFKFVCKQQHPILEAYYVGQRILIAPESCSDYLA